MTKGVFKLEFSTDSNAFRQFSCGGRETKLAKVVEVHRILEVVISQVIRCSTKETIQDYNGNTIGKWSLDNKQGRER